MAASPSWASGFWSNEKMKYDFGLISPSRFWVSVASSNAMPLRSRSSFTTASGGMWGYRLMRSSTRAVREASKLGRTLAPAACARVRGMDPSYDRHRSDLTATRRADPRIRDAIWAAIGDAETVVNVGAGAGSYEPPQTVLAVEPSARMIAQRPPGSAPVVQVDGRGDPARRRCV